MKQLMIHQRNTKALQNILQCWYNLREHASVKIQAL